MFVYVLDLDTETIVRSFGLGDLTISQVYRSVASASLIKSIFVIAESGTSTDGFILMKLNDDSIIPSVLGIDGTLGAPTLTKAVMSDGTITGVLAT